MILAGFLIVAGFASFCGAPVNLQGEEQESIQNTYINSLAMEFARIQPGSFMMGSNLSPADVEMQYGGEAKWYEDEGPQHNVTLTKPFYMQTSEVTQGQWVAVMGVNPSMYQNCGDNYPVDKVSWNDVDEFITRLNLRENTDKYRLPSEAEWEYACRAGQTEAFSFGGDKKKLGDYGWFHDNSRGWPHHVYQKSPNAWGLYDMHGNVWEWCQDWYGKYPSESVTDPRGPDSGTHRVSRGGSWRSVSRFCRSAHRFGVDPGYRRPNRGLRLAKDP
jgi:formylglycine-generating enzyme required for sulfatase activity